MKEINSLSIVFFKILVYLLFVVVVYDGDTFLHKMPVMFTKFYQSFLFSLLILTLGFVSSPST